MSLELAIVIVIVNAAAFFMGRNIWRSVRTSRGKTPERSGCGGTCQGCSIEMKPGTIRKRSVSHE